MAAAAKNLTAAPDAQDGLFDQIIENEMLERALEKREAAKVTKGKATKAYKEIHDQAKGIIGTLELAEDTTVRVGRFRLKNSSVDARHVEFDTDPTSRMTISLIPAD